MESKITNLCPNDKCYVVAHLNLMRKWVENDAEKDSNYFQNNPMYSKNNDFGYKKIMMKK